MIPLSPSSDAGPPVEEGTGVRLHVLHVLKGLGPGGAERLLVSLCSNRSPGTRFEVAYLLPHKSHLVAELEAAGATVHLIGGRAGLRNPLWVHRLGRLVRSTGPDVVHVHSPSVAAVVRPALRLTRDRPVLVSNEQNVWGSYRRATRWANGITIPLGDHHFAVSQGVRESMWTRLQRDTEVLPNGIPVTRLASRRGERDSARADLGLSDEDVFVVSVANFREKKDHPSLFAAAAACSSEAKLHFAVIGQGPLEQELRAMWTSLHLEQQVRFIGYHPDPPAIVVAADLFVISSVHEGLPIAMLEAMALGVPTVATSVGGIPEVITDDVDGVLVPPRRPDLLADAIRRLADDPDRRRRLSIAAMERVRDFDIESTQRRLEQRYHELLTRS